MKAFSNFLAHLDVDGLLLFLMCGVAGLFCITIHELSHGLVAYRLGDPTAKLNGRLTLNPRFHIDPIGLVMLLTVGVGWAKPVPVDPRNFKSPKAGMVLTALAGPVSNFLTAFFMLRLGSVLVEYVPTTMPVAYLLIFICYISAFSVGIGLFNLIPIPPLDGSKILFSVLPDRIYRIILRYERLMMIVVILLVWFGIFVGPLSVAMSAAIRGICAVTRFPYEIFTACGFF